MLRDLLKQATTNDHTELEKAMFVNEIMDITLSIDKYKKIITANYIVHKAFEKFLTKNLSKPVADKLDLQNRLKLPALKKDVEDLKIEEPLQPKNAKIIFEKNDAEILGAMYVLEGATLGGKVILSKLKKNLNFPEPKPAFHYYNLYGENLIANWQKFCAVINEQPEENNAAVINGAKKMFAYIFSTMQNING
jgi:heme oxygenase